MPDTASQDTYTQRDDARDWAAGVRDESRWHAAMDRTERGQNRHGEPIYDNRVSWERMGLVEGMARPTEAVLTRTLCDPWLGPAMLRNPNLSDEQRARVVGLSMDNLGACDDPSRFRDHTRWQRLNGVLNRSAETVDMYARRHGRLPGAELLRALGWIGADLSYGEDEPSLATIRARALHQTLRKHVTGGLGVAALARLYRQIARRAPRTAAQVVTYRAAGPALYRRLLGSGPVTHDLLDEIAEREDAWSEPGCREALRIWGRKTGHPKVLLGLLGHEPVGRWRGWFCQLSGDYPSLAALALERHPEMAAATLRREDLVPMLAAEDVVTRRRALHAMAEVGATAGGG